MEGDAGSGQLNPTPQPAPDADIAVSQADSAEVDTAQPISSQVSGSTEQPAPTRPSRLGSRRWVIGASAALVVLSLLVATGGFLALRTHRQSETIATAEVAALAAAKDCVAATQAPDTSAMEASQRKIIDCATGDFGAQATLYSGVLVDAYRVSNAQVQVTDMRAAVESYNGDGSMDILVALRVKVTNSAAADQEQGYRLRVLMAPDSGTYKIARLDQVSK